MVYTISLIYFPLPFNWWISYWHLNTYRVHSITLLPSIGFAQKPLLTSSFIFSYLHFLVNLIKKIFRWNLEPITSQNNIFFANNREKYVNIFYKYLYLNFSWNIQALKSTTNIVCIFFSTNFIPIDLTYFW